MKSSTVVVLSCILATLAATANAKVVRWLYEVDVPVESQAERRQAAREGLRELLLRVTGLPALPANAELRAGLSSPEEYYGRFEFATRATAPKDNGDDQAEQLILRLHYDAPSVLALVRRAGLPVWSADRPTALAWIALDAAGSRDMLAAGSAPQATSAYVAAELVDALQRRARQRGIELSLPLMDLADWTVTPAVLWGRFWTPIESASRRYASDLILIGRVSMRADGSWLAEWDLRASPSGDGRIAGRSDPARMASATHAVVSGVDYLADVLSQRFAVGGQLAVIPVTIRGASTIPAYASVLKYLRSREYIQRLDVKSVAIDALTLHVHSRSSGAQMEELLSMGNQLAALPQSNERAGARTLQFAWRGER